MTDAGPPVVVRTATPADFPAVAELTVRVYVDGGFTGASYAPRLADAAGRAAAGDLLVAEDPATRAIVGTASLFGWQAGPEWSERAGPGEAVLRMLAVDEAARGRGIGAALTRSAIVRARRMGCHRLRLLTQPNMQAAHRLYQRLGFERAPDLDWEPEPGIPLIGYRYQL
ncbi:MAG TPA: GNAT family N-acetyltransferase [Mycobacteriales bacterium]|nr:GNAT family N-acetyltransferase [Mycobacteriales bacterium]